jgi:hypothetical protein
MKGRHYWNFAFLLAVPLALFTYAAECNSWQPKTIELRGARVAGLKFSPNGRYLLVRDEIREVAPDIIVCDVVKRQKVKTIPEAGNPYFLEQGKSLVVFSSTMRNPNAECIRVFSQIAAVKAAPSA